MKYRISLEKVEGRVDLELPFSKSILNRYLILSKLAGKEIPNESDSFPNDVNLMIRTLNSKEKEINIEDAGTVMRFATAFFSVIEGERILKGSERMHKRPIGILVDTLRNMGAEIEYLEKEGYPPLKIRGGKLHGGQFKIAGDVSSQFISAVLMIAPLSAGKVKIQLTGKILSRPYIDMTLDVMGAMGVEYSIDQNLIEIDPQLIESREFIIERDWSSAAFVYQFAALSSNSKILLNDMKFVSFQGDAACIHLYSKVGVESKEHLKGIVISRKESTIPEELEVDFTEIPDLFQSFTMTCFALGIKLKAIGLHNLHLKESDRINSLRNTIEKLGGQVMIGKSFFQLKSVGLNEFKGILRDYNDHRLTMSIASTLPAFEKLYLDDISAVKKSFPNYWQEMKKLGIQVVEID